MVHAQGGLASTQALVGLSLAIIAIMFAANLVAMHYTRGALRVAATAGARAGALFGSSPESCERRAGAVLFGETGLLRGPYGSDARVRCTHVGATVRAVASATAVWWIDVFPPVTLRVAVEVAAETRPAEALPRWNGSSP